METPEDDEIRSQLSSAGSFQEPLQPSANENVPPFTPTESDIARRRQVQQQQHKQPYSEPFVNLTASAPIPMPMPGTDLLGPSSKERDENILPKQQPSIGRKPVGSLNSTNVTPLPYPADRPPLLHKVLGPRPMLPPRPGSSSITGPSRPLARSPGKENVRLQPWSEGEQERLYGQNKDIVKERSNGVVNDSIGALADGFDRLSPYSSNPHGGMAGTSASAGSIEEAKGIQVTLIRRDPGSGAQWNVGRLEVSRGSPRDARRQSVSGGAFDEGGVGAGTGAGVLVEITNEGYEKFVADQSRGDQQHYSDDTGDTVTPGTPFRRWLNLGPPKSPTSASLTPDGLDGSSRNNGFRSSLDFSSSSRRSSMQQPQSPFNQQPPYTFLSPWSTPCTFTTGLAGKSLKCRHVSYDSSLPPLNLNTASRTISSSQSRSRSTKEEGSQISELRFNLPATAFLSKTKGQTGGTGGSKRPQLISSMSATAAVTRARERASMQLGTAPALPPRPVSHQGQGYREGSYGGHMRAKSDDASASSSYLYPSERGSQPSFQSYGDQELEGEGEEEEAEFNPLNGDGDVNERLDLSLGQERAGGGFSGKKAKLGKLIVENEGLAMLDLVVAANMGVWWWIGAAREGKD